MLHILWMILKFILIVLGILLGVLVLALLLFLFCPVRYQAEGAGDYKEWKKAQAYICVSWLFRGITLRISLREGKISHSIRLFGILLSGNRHGKKKKAARRTLKKESVNKELPTEQKEMQKPDLPKAKDIPKTEDIPHAEAAGDDPREASGKPERQGLFFRIRNKASAFLEKLKKIPEVFRNLFFKLQKMYDTIDFWKQFLSHPQVKDAISFAWQKGKGLLKHIFPTRIEGHISLGSEDPSITGAVLAVLGTTMAFHKNCIEVTPVFEGSNLLCGNVKLRGRVYGYRIVKTALQIYFNKNIKYVINRWKHKEETL